MDKTETPRTDAEVSRFEHLLREPISQPATAELANVSIRLARTLERENADLRRQLAAERGRVGEMKERCAKVADKHRALIADHNPDAPRTDLVAQGYGNASLNIAHEIRSIRALADPQQSALPDRRKPGPWGPYPENERRDAQQSEQNAEGHPDYEPYVVDGKIVGYTLKNCPPVSSAPERDALVKRQDAIDACLKVREKYLASVKYAVNDCIDAISALSPAGVVVPKDTMLRCSWHGGYGYKRDCPICNSNLKDDAMSKLAHSNQETMDQIKAAARKDDGTEHCQCDACADGFIHDSDCSVHNMPAMPNGPCDCGVYRRRFAYEKLLLRSSEQELENLRLAAEKALSAFGCVFGSTLPYRDDGSPAIPDKAMTLAVEAEAALRAALLTAAAKEPKK